MNQFPAELVDIILKHLDKRSLTSSSLVSRSWAELSRPYLFRQISCIVYPVVKLESNEDPRGGDAPAHRYKLETFLEFLRGTPRVQRHIHYLRILTPKSEGEEAQFHRPQFQTLAEVLKCLPCLKIFHTSILPHPHLDSTIVPVVSHLDKLIVVFSPFDVHAIERLVQLLGLFDTIEHLDIDASFTAGMVGHKILDDAASVSATLSTRLHTLTVPFPSLLYALRTLPQFSNLHILETGVIDPCDVHMLSGVLKKVGPNLRSFKLSLHETMSIYHPIHNLSHLLPLDFSSSTNLSRLSIHIPIYGSTSGGGNFPQPCFADKAYNLLCEWLPTLPTSISTITFALRFVALVTNFTRIVTFFNVQPLHPMRSDWANLDSVLERCCDRGIRIQFQLSPHGVPEGDFEYITKALPGLFKKDGVRFIRGSELSEQVAYTSHQSL